MQTSTSHRGFAMRMVVVCVFGLVVCGVAAPASASWGESTLFVGGGYMPVSTREMMLHNGMVALGGTYFISDFALVAAEALYGATWAGERFHQLMGVDAAFRLLLDVTQWVPSFGPSVGWMGHYDHDQGFSQGMNLGLSVCVDYRPWRDRSVGLCGQLAVFPFSEQLQGIYLISANLSAFLPYFFQ